MRCMRHKTEIKRPSNIPNGNGTAVLHKTSTKMLDSVRRSLYEIIKQLFKSVFVEDSFCECVDVLCKIILPKKF